MQPSLTNPRDSAPPSGARLLSLVLLGALVGSAWSGGAHAQDSPLSGNGARVLLLSTTQDPGLDRARQRAEAAVRQGLDIHEWRVETPDGAMAGVLRDCPEPGTCVRQLLAAAGVREAVHVVVWGEGEEPRSVVVAFETDDGAQYAGTSEVAGGTLEEAARRAFVQAVAVRRERSRVSFRVVGTPEGATVTVDGTPSGRLPFTGQHPRGPVELTVSAHGYRAERRLVDLSETTEVRFALTPSGASDLTEDAARRSLTAPLLLTGAGAVTLLTTLAAVLPRLGCAERFDDGTCRTERVLGAPAAVYLGLGGALLLGGLTWTILRITRGRTTELSSSPGSVQLRF